MKALLTVALILAVVVTAGCSTSTSDIPSDVPAYNGPPGTGGIIISIPRDVAEAMAKSVSSRFPLWSYLLVQVREVSTQTILGQAWVLNTGIPQLVQITGIAAGKVVDVPVNLYAGGNTGVSPPTGGTWATAGIGGPVTIVDGQNVNVPIVLQAKSPGVASVSPADGSTVPASFTFSAQVTPGSAASGTPTSSVAGVSQTSTSPSWNLGPFANGPLTVELEEVDTSSNALSNGRMTRTVQYTVSGGGGGDTTPPDTTITSGPSGTVATPNVTFQWTGSDNVDPPGSLVYSFRLVGLDPAWSNYDSAVQADYFGLADGPYTFEVRARDTAGNVDPTPAARSFTVDTSGGGWTGQFDEWPDKVVTFYGPNIAGWGQYTSAIDTNATPSGGTVAGKSIFFINTSNESLLLDAGQLQLTGVGEGTLVGGVGGPVLVDGVLQPNGVWEFDFCAYDKLGDSDPNTGRTTITNLRVDLTNNGSWEYQGDLVLDQTGYQNY